ncbi:DUF1934 domain-containing protein [Lentibacillus saliphilus]|uniref:DUF1934 domain-containing protein n=1 Tax=Lentibacillus saliphilus TaxID=2737028 RepID=UPI001C3038E4|nr:DUF1934 domain-containing protein [Lentibacillus saliphilus]
MKVSIELRTAVEDQDQVEYHTTHAIGDLYRKGATDVIMFEEKTDDGTIQNMMTIQADKVSIKRTGALTMHQQFKHKQSTENVLRHPYVTIHMETWTDAINYDTERGHLSVYYTVKLNGQEPRKQQLDVSIKDHHTSVTHH